MRRSKVLSFARYSRCRWDSSGRHCCHSRSRLSRMGVESGARTMSSLRRATDGGSQFLVEEGSGVAEGEAVEDAVDACEEHVMFVEEKPIIQVEEEEAYVGRGARASGSQERPVGVCVVRQGVGFRGLSLRYQRVAGGGICRVPAGQHPGVCVVEEIAEQVAEARADSASFGLEASAQRECQQRRCRGVGEVDFHGARTAAFTMALRG
eukprot:6180736-Pleurochrysis_carterae.AAC.2